MNCDFDLGHTCMLQQDLYDDFDWDVEKNGTEVRGTGPDGDHTSRKGTTVCFILSFTYFGLYLYVCMYVYIYILEKYPSCGRKP